MTGFGRPTAGLLGGMTQQAMPPPQPTGDEPLGALVHRLTEQVPELVRSELRLAQAELKEKGKSAGVGVGAFGAAGLMALYGVACLLAAAIIALALVLPAWLSALIVGAALLLGAGLVAVAGRKSVQHATPPTPERALSGIKEDVATVKGRHR
jgi:uncharacterized membrane protein YqjE